MGSVTCRRRQPGRYNARREHPGDLRSRLAQVAEQRREAASAKHERRLERRERALRRRLARAEAFTRYDWGAAEADFGQFVGDVTDVPGVYEPWRAQGVPIRMLLRAGFRPQR